MAVTRSKAEAESKAAQESEEEMNRRLRPLSPAAIWAICSWLIIIGAVVVGGNYKEVISRDYLIDHFLVFFGTLLSLVVFLFTGEYVTRMGEVYETEPKTWMLFLGWFILLVIFIIFLRMVHDGLHHTLS